MGHAGARSAGYRDAMRLLLVLSAGASLACASRGRPPALEPARPVGAARAGGVALRAPGVSSLLPLVGTWDVSGRDPETARTYTLRYRVRAAVRGVWLLGDGSSPELGLEVHDVWGRDAETGALVRVLFDSEGTSGRMTSRGWSDDGVLVLEGFAHAGGRAVPVRETITRDGDDALDVVWESETGAGWKAYAVERLVRAADAE
jgi:hypothetical protein